MCSQPVRKLPGNLGVVGGQVMNSHRPIVLVWSKIMLPGKSCRIKKQWSSRKIKAPKNSYMICANSQNQERAQHV